ncbi:MAG: nucleotidyltransferase family protein [Bacteroidetes bacterium]|nr:nucleotidyltransferase family protein [Bacteroidota bacterium]
MLPISTISKKYGDEQALLVLLCRVFIGKANSEDINSFISDHQLNWDIVLSGIQQHKIGAIAYNTLSNTIADKTFIHQLKTETAIRAVYGSEQEKEILRIYDLIRKKGIAILPYKGPTFATQYYGSASLRQSTDIDFLMPRESLEDLENIIDILRADGYTPMYDIPLGYRKLLFQNTCEFYFDKYRNEIRTQHVEFHWLAHHPVFDLPVNIPNSMLFNNTQRIELASREIEVLGAENTLLTLLLHHGIKENWASLRHILDFAMVIKNGNIRWGDLYDTSRKYNIENALNVGLTLVEELLGVETAQIISKKVTTTRFIDNILNKKQKKSLAYHQWQKIKLLDNNRARIKLIKKQVKYVFTPSILDNKFISLPERFHFLYIFVKVIRRSLTVFSRKTTPNV